MIKMYYSEKCVCLSLYRNLVHCKTKNENLTQRTQYFFAAIVCESRFILKKKLSSSVFIVKSYNVIFFKVFSKLHFNDFKRYNTRIF